MTIGELADQTGVTPRTIRYYVEQGLLPAPEYGRPAEYTDEHARRLDLIRRLKEQYLPLEEIRDILGRLSLEQVEELASQETPPAPTAKTAASGTPLSSAADYISQVLGRGAAREQLKQAAPSQAPLTPPVARTPPAAPGRAVPAAPAGRAAPPPAAPAPPAAEFAAAAQDQETQPLPATAAPPETWQRIPLAPGVELHVAATADASQQNVVARLIAAVRHILEEPPEKEGK